MYSKWLPVIATLFCSTGAFASKARLQALGQGDNGSYYIMDSRNVFLNPAEMAGAKDSANFEWGASGRPNSTPNAEGGFIHSFGDMKFGLQLGRESMMETNIGLVKGLGTLGTSGTAANTDLYVPEDTIQLLFGGGTDMKWGASVLYQKSANNLDAFPKREGSGCEVTGGVATESFSAHVLVNFLNKTETETSATAKKEYEGDVGVKVGGTYNLTESQKLFAEVAMDKGTAKDNADTNKFELDIFDYQVGFANVMAKEGNTTFFYSLAFSSTKTKKDDKLGSSDTKSESMKIPVTVGLETEANSWMVLRGSVKQNVLLAQGKEGDDKTENSPNSTVVSAGPGFKFNNMTLDGTFAGVSTGNINSTSFLANVGMTYSF